MPMTKPQLIDALVAQASQEMRKTLNWHLSDDDVFEEIQGETDHILSVTVVYTTEEGGEVFDGSFSTEGVDP